MPDAVDPRERFSDWDEASTQEAQGNQAHMWTAIPVIIKKHDTEKNTVHAQATIKLSQVKPDGTTEWKEIPKLEDLPIHYPSGGGATMTFPVKDGDEGLAIFSSRSIDKWWQQGGTQEQLHNRMHDLSDGFVIPGFRSQPKKLTNVSATNFQLRTDNGADFFEFDPTNKKLSIKMTGDISIESTSKVTLKAASIILDGTCILGGPSGGVPASMQGTVDSSGDTDVSNFATKVKVI